MANNLSENFYDILNIRKDASMDEIKRAYRNLARQYHPDKNNTPGAAERFKMISRAHQVLSDPVKRREYDEGKSKGFDFNDSDDSWSNFDNEYWKDVFRRFFPNFDDDEFTTTGRHEGFSNHMRSSETRNYSARERSKEQNSSRNQEFGRTGFSTQFGGKRKPDFGSNYSTNEPSSASCKRPRQEPSSTSTSSNSASSLPKDPAIERPLEVSLEEIARGCTKKFQIKRTINDERGCSTQEEKLIEIPIRPGWKAGTKLTYERLGDKYPGRDPADITFILKDKPHALFSRDSDNNLLHKANVSLKKALLGVSYCIQGLNGKRHDINVKDIVHPGYVKRYPGEGLPLPKTPSKRADLIVTFNIEFPTFLSWDQRRVISDCLPN